jgi:hypothetical protein
MEESTEEEERRKGIQRMTILKRSLRVIIKRKMRMIISMKVLLKILKLTVKRMQKKET